MRRPSQRLGSDDDRLGGILPGGGPPFSDYSLVVEHPGYYLATFEKLQIFPGIETVQNVPLVPLPQPPAGQDAAEPVVVTPQPL